MTVGYPIPFATRETLLPSATPTHFAWSYSDPNLGLDLTFPQAMDQTVSPAVADLIILVDGVPKTPDSLEWFTATEMTLDYSEALLGPSVLRLQYPLMAPNFISLVGQPVFPFDLLGVES